jgi:GNAT superfamily N-acetyltransferase
MRRKALVLCIRRMTALDVSLGMRLKSQAGWNQTEADWQRFLDLEPEGCFVAELDGVPMATTVVCTFGPVAWVAMVLVDAAVRGRGIGTELMRHALAYLDGRGVRSVRLDATPLGRPLYEKLGFVAQFELARHEGVLPPAPQATGVEPARPEDFEELLAQDRAVTATDRRLLLLRFFAEQPNAVRIVRRAGRCLAFLTARPGTRALQIGPCIAAPDVGPLLFADAWHRYAGEYVFIDIPMGNTRAVDLVAAHGLTVQRHLLRMCRGEVIVERIEELWASSGPAKG